MLCDRIVNCVSLDCFKAGVFDQRNQFAPRHLHFVVGFDRITLGQLAAFGDRAVNIVRAKVQSDLGQVFPSITQ